jgi:hypothetical protein
VREAARPVRSQRLQRSKVRAGLNRQCCPPPTFLSGGCARNHERHPPIGGDARLRLQGRIETSLSGGPWRSPATAFLNGQEFATAVHYGLPIVVILLDNGMYGTIRMHQEREYPGRISATTLRNPDFSAYATPSAAMASASRRRKISPQPSPAPSPRTSPRILHCLVDPEAITPTTTITACRRRRWRGRRGNSGNNGVMSGPYYPLYAQIARSYAIEQLSSWQTSGWAAPKKIRRYMSPHRV